MPMARDNDSRCEDPPPGWSAGLTLTLSRRDNGTVLSRRDHHGPLLVQKALYPEGREVCHLLLLHPPGGLVSGDALTLDLTLEADSHLLLTTPGAGKWYRCETGSASQTLRARLAKGAILEWLPQENILFDGCDARLGMAVTLESGALFMGLEMLCLGRRAGGERFDRGRVTLDSRVLTPEGTLWREQGAIIGGSPWMMADAGLGGHGVTGTLMVAGVEIDPEWLEVCRRIPVADGLRTGVTRLPRMLLARALGHDSETLRHWLRALWQALRPLVAGRTGVLPRIWNT
ncbi:MAG: urease accessory protein UreD [Magnetococcales bacterium]|nr:urease accessory protein UreD [Magnetococcales bacterium]